MDKDRSNPFTESRTSLITTNTLLFYGENDYSLFKRLKQNKRLYSSQLFDNPKEAEEKILWRYEKEFYSMDESGHSLAEQAFNRKLEAQNRQKEDFWQKIAPSFNRKTKQNPFTNSETTSTSSIASNISTDSSIRSIKDLKKSTISSRQTNRVEISKLRKTINEYKKIDQTQSKQQNEEKFSVMHMYKKKKTQESFHPAFTFSQVQSKVKQEEKPKFQYPQSIYVREEQYFFVPLG